MEFTRSYIVNIVNFYFLLENPEITSFQDAIAVWSNKYKSNELKAILQLVGNLHNIYEIHDKESAKKAIESYLKLLLVKSRSFFKDTGIDSTRCRRALVPLLIISDNFPEELRQFKIEFDKTFEHQSNCGIYYFLTTKHSSSISLFLSTKASSSCSKGFESIVEYIAEINKNGASKCTCRMCGNIGDAVICLDCPTNMVLVHSDDSFDDICKIIKQNHNKLHSEIAHIKLYASP
jgi:hypothetical protein